MIDRDREIFISFVGWMSGSSSPLSLWGLSYPINSWVEGVMSLIIFIFM